MRSHAMLRRRLARLLHRSAAWVDDWRPLEEPIVHPRCATDLRPLDEAALRRQHDEALARAPMIVRLPAEALARLRLPTEALARCPVCGNAGGGHSTSMGGRVTSRVYAACGHTIRWDTAQDREDWKPGQ